MLTAVKPTDLTEQIVVRISPALRSKLKARAAEAERTEAQEVRLAIRHHCAASDPSGEAA